MRATDLGLLTSLGSLAAHPDGVSVVVSVTHPDLDADATVGQLWRVPLDGSGARRITRGFRDAAPRFSPDGSVLAFLRALPGTPPQLTVIRAEGSEAITLTDQPLGVAEFQFSDTGEEIIYTARLAETGRYGTVEGLSAAAEPARRIASLQYKANGVGYTRDRRHALHSVTVPDLAGEPVYVSAPRPEGAPAETSSVPESRVLLHDSADLSRPRVHAGRVYFLAARHERHDRDLLTQVWSIPLNGGEVREETPLGVWSISDFEVSPSGDVWFVAQDVGEQGIDFVARNAGLFRAAEGVDRLTDTSFDLGDIYSGIVFRGDEALVLDRTQGRRQLVAVSAAGESTVLTHGDVEVESVAVVGDRIAVTVATPNTFGDVAVVGGSDGSGVSLVSDFSASLRATGNVTPAELTVRTRDGAEVHGWVAVPHGDGPVPTLLMIHGGPFAAYSVHLFDEVQVLVDAGYAVVFCNPRGSAGYGEDHGRSIRRAMGGVDMTDVLDFLDAAIAGNARLDADRLGILGGSYGGYLTAWTIAHDHRFRTAIVERGYLDPEAFVGSSDIGWFFGQEYNGTDLELIRTQSPQAVVDQVQTPTLVIHSEADLRCPLGQAETYYASLALRGVETEMLIFPGEDHELSRSGRPRHRLQRFEAILEWLGRYL